MPTLMSHKTPRARRPQWCMECENWMPVGTVYVRQTSVDSDGWHTYTAHLDCWERAVAVEREYPRAHPDDWYPLTERDPEWVAENRPKEEG